MRRRSVLNPFSEVRKIEADVLIIGGGVAGMMAAVGCIRSGVQPILITKATFPSGSSSMARGGYTAAMGHSEPTDRPEFLYEDSIEASYGICNHRLMRIMSEEAIDRTIELDAWGLGLVRMENGNYHQKKSASHRFPRLLHCGKLMGKPLMQSLARKMREWGVKTIQHAVFVDLMKVGERVVGAWGFMYREGVPIVVHARSTIMATGGAPQLHEVNDSPPYISGDGYAMALRAGAELIDMEFIDYQLLAAAPLNIRGYPPHTSGFINAGAFLYNNNGERFMWNYDPERGERATRAVVNRGVGMEIFEGRGTENHGIYLDARHVIEEVNDGATADIIRVFKTQGVDMAESPIEVASGPHTYLGGIRIDEWGRTNLLGFYAGGEAAGGVHGANRTGGAALADSYVFGLRSGIGAACEGTRLERPDPESGGWQEGIEKLREIEARTHGSDDKQLRLEVQQVGVEGIGQIREEARLEKALSRLDELEAENALAVVAGDAYRKRFDCMRRIQENHNLIGVARMLAVAALARKESRGGHFRIDYPEIDEAWRCNLVLSLEDGKVMPRRQEVVEASDSALVPGETPTTAALVEQGGIGQKNSQHFPPAILPMRNDQLKPNNNK